MEINEAIQILKDNAIGSNQYENLKSWQEIDEAIQFELSAGEERARQLGELAERVGDMTEDNGW
ncbi:hypothetical protein FP371_23140 [Citrobacter freundii]|uniref:hypothetical protein n=1 Tax=Gammaproteobacteria TaxID=1236 RepID=UPI0005CFB034|nr:MULTISPECIES: hypothetical protein [Gammaproteobacteria]EEA2350737.1 hypothetical protein [Salmonella enterica subsp. enterica serovar Enteritidis]EEC4304157.1 hypothetical protein [Salmonella enterica subsp. enterica serovar Enteritidis]EEN2406581.1 hypothetical protein [Salmonella enterica subsp. enterica serovar Enteritidis]EES8921627.1 hypothetical protein [Escherichia coli]EES9862945.1 hypothetical protein [Escherichia coli]